MGMRVMGEDQQGFRRRVFYIPGFDPIHPRRYRELYRSEGRAQAAISGYQIDLKPKKVKGPYGWQVNASIDGAQAQAEVEVLVWSDIVKLSMAGGILATYWQLARTAWAYIGSGALFRLMQLRKGPIIAALYPIVMLLVQLAVALAAGWGVGALAGYLVHPVAGWAVGLALVWLVLRAFRRADNKIFAYYLMHDYAFTAQARGAIPAELEARMTAFRGSIREALAGDYDEVLVVGHSSGAHLAVSILADLIREGMPEGRAALAFLSLGQVVPMVSFLPEAKRLRADLHFLSARDELVWIDVTAPGDGCAFALCDPVAVSGVAPDDQRWPLVISAAFTQTLSPERWRALRWRFFRLHFQYLCAFDRPGDYDYFRITAGAVTLRARYDGRPASKSRITRAISGYRTMA
jgi:hypothetical protein